jgi:hypothetical protein
VKYKCVGIIDSEMRNLGVVWSSNAVTIPDIQGIRSTLRRLYDQLDPLGATCKYAPLAPFRAFVYSRLSLIALSVMSKLNGRSDPGTRGRE